jgi:hypothetical protein
MGYIHENIIKANRPSRTNKLGAYSELGDE